jgi:hypothetical protein
MVMADFAAIDALLYESLAQLRGRLSEKDYTSAKESIDAGEPGLGLETICAQLHEYETRLPRRVYDLLARAGQLMGMPEKTWKILLPLIDE